MKSLSIFKILFFVGLAVFLFPACDPDDGLGGGGGTGTTTTGPTVTATLADGFDSAVLAPGTAFTVTLNATAGESDLKSLTVYEGGFTLDPTQIVSNSGVTTPNNPQLILGDAVTGFIWDITLTASSDMTELSYEFEVEDVDGNRSNPSVLITTETAVVTEPVSIMINGSDFQAVAGSLSSINLTILGNGNTLSTIAVYEDGTLINDQSDRLFYKEIGNPFTSNPFPFAEGDAAAFEGNILVRAIEGTHNLTFEVTDTDGDSYSSVVGYTTDSGPTGTPLSGEYTAKIVYNASGPNLGGLDLDSGNVVSAFDSSADIVDSGIDQSGASPFWIQTIQPANGASLRTVNETMETFTYSSVVTKEAIEAAYNNGDEISQSGTVEVGDLYTVRANGVNYLLVVTNVNITSNDNEDSYTFDIKF